MTRGANNVSFYCLYEKFEIQIFFYFPSDIWKDNSMKHVQVEYSTVKNTTLSSSFVLQT